MTHLVCPGVSIVLLGPDVPPSPHVVLQHCKDSRSFQLKIFGLASLFRMDIFGLIFKCLSHNGDV